MTTTEFLDLCESEVTTGAKLPSQYVEQCYIAWVEGSITREEFYSRTNSIENDKAN